MALGRSTFARFVSVGCFGALALALSACSSLSGALRADSALHAGPPRAVEAVTLADAELVAASVTTGAADDLMIVAAAPATADAAVTDASTSDEGMAQARETAEMEAEEYDPWEGFNETMFEFNRHLDKYILKPVAKGYNLIMPDEIQIMVSNGFDNIAFVPRLVNSLLQGKVGGAGRELGRFLINSTLGVAGLFDPAKDVFGLQKSREDFGQTLGVWGLGPGAYLVLPFMEPLTVRDGVGKAVDTLFDPLSYFLPFIWDRLAMKVGDIVNERSLNLDLFQGFEESVIDMYSAVRHAYLQRRLKLIRE
jgi:phospholipid-binding lipoprotein MlaA